MSNKVFLAKNWLAHSLDETTKSIDADLTQSFQKPKINPQAPSAFSPFIKKSEPKQEESKYNKYFTPGWTGDSLLSKEVNQLKKVLDLIFEDVFYKIKKAPHFSKKIQSAIFSEFLLYTEHQALNLSEIDNIQDFWENVQNDNSPYKDELTQFLKIFSLRVSSIYLLKVRFILTLIDNENIQFNLKYLLCPNAFITQVFPKGSSLELDISAFEQNVFSWYQPDPSLGDTLLKYRDIYKKISIHELIKNISIKIEKSSGYKSSYSHSLSHQQFGLFLNSLLINIPIWLSSFQEKKEIKLTGKTKELEIISSHYSGNYLESLSLSHWLAQNKNKDIKWDQVLCPEFSKNSFRSGLYLKIFNELQALTFLAKIAQGQGHEPKKFVCKITNAHIENKYCSDDIQKSFWSNDDQFSTATYDRVVINLARSPKNNPQHHLITTIQQQTEILKQNGYLFVLSNKKLFLPSLKSKLDSLLKEFKVECILNLDNISGKGEIPHYIYVLSKQLPDETRINKKTSCFNFRLSGNLNTFQDFHQITNLVNIFMEKFLGDPPPIYQNQYHDCKLEFHQDAVLDGKLIHASNRDSSKVTHPLFFEKLMKVCRPLDYFFSMKQIDFHPEVSVSDDEFYLQDEHNQSLVKSPYSLIVDQRSGEQTSIEIIKSTSLEAKSYEYGHSDCFYFEITPKWPSLSINSVKDYLNSSIGRQIIDLTFNNEQTKVKRNLAKILLPVFFAQNENLPDHILKGLSLFKLSDSEILSKHPKDLERDFNRIDMILNTISKDYPGQVFSLLSSFSNSLQLALDTLKSNGKNTQINFNNPIIKTPLILTKKTALYPNNKEVYISFHTSALNEIHRPLTKISLEIDPESEDNDYFLNLYSDDEHIASIYSSNGMIQFIHFLLTQVYNVPISNILQGIQVPSIQDIENLIQSYITLKEVIEQISKKLPLTYNRLINYIISQ